MQVSFNQKDSERGERLFELVEWSNEKMIKIITFINTNTKAVVTS